MKRAIGVSLKVCAFFLSVLRHSKMPSAPFGAVAIALRASSGQDIAPAKSSAFSKRELIKAGIFLRASDGRLIGRDKIQTNKKITDTT